MATALSTDSVVLALSQSEATTLRMILAYVGGSPEHSRRGDADSITRALSDAGIHWFPTHDGFDGPFESNPLAFGPSLMFRDSLETL